MQTPMETPAQAVVSVQCDRDTAKLPVGPVVGIVIGCVAGGIMIGAVAIWYGRRLPSKNQVNDPLELELDPEMSTAPWAFTFIPPKPPT
jgi:hypothetical protein